MPTQVFLPDCLLECYEFLYPTIDLAAISFYDGMPYPYSLGSQDAITLTWGYWSGINIYMRSGIWNPCDDAAGFTLFLILAHELVHVLQIMNLPDPKLWIPNYLGHFTRSRFSGDCSNDLEQEAYQHVNGCDGPGASGGDLRDCVTQWDAGFTPCDCTAAPILKLTTFPTTSGGVASFLDLLKANCSDLVMERSRAFTPYHGNLVSLIGITVVDLFAVPTSSELGGVLGTLGVVAGIVLAVILVGLSLWLIPAILLGALLGWLVFGLIGSLIDWIVSLFSGPSNQLWQEYVGADGSGALNPGGFKTKSTPFVPGDGFIYFQGTDNTVWKVNLTDQTGSKLGGFKSNSAPWVGSDGFVYFQGTDNTLWQVSAATAAGTPVGGFKAKSMPCVPGDGFIYFQGTDDKVWKVPTAGSGGVNLGGFKSHSTPFAAPDGFVYFQGTDNTLWKVDAGSGSGAKVGGFQAKSMPFVPGDGFVYFQGTDNKLWKVATDGSGGVNLGGFQTSSPPFVGRDGFVYFQGTDNTLWQVSSADGSGRRIPGYRINSSPFVPGDGFAYFQGA